MGGFDSSSRKARAACAAIWMRCELWARETLCAVRWCRRLGLDASADGAPGHSTPSLD